MQRTYLFVPPEEKSEVQALGARWDADSKRWYIDSGGPTATFSRWLLGAEPEEDFTITSADAYVAAATAACPQCRAAVTVICIHCASGVVLGDPLTEFTVADVSAVGDSLARQLTRWPNYRPAEDTRCFTNHCPGCGAALDDLYLHSEPGEPFFDIPAAPPGAIELTPLEGPIELSGDEHFRID